MNYSIVVAEYALRQLKKIDKQMLPRLKAVIASLAETPRPHGLIKLTGEEAYRIRVGDYRIVYEIEDDKLIVIVVDVDHRKQIYR